MPFKFNPFSGNLDYYESATSGTGDVVGPASSTDNAIVRFDGTTGKLVQNSTVLVSDTGAITGAASLNLSGLTASQPVVTDGSKNLSSVSYATFASSLGAVTTLSAIGASPNANAATISGTTLNLQPASASFGGVVTTGTQTLAGAKTFSGITTVSNSTASTSSTTGALVVTGGVGIGGSIFINGDITGESSTVITGGSSASNNLTLRSTSNATKGQVYIDETTAASSTTTGALRVGGGAGIGGRVYSVGLTSTGSVEPSFDNAFPLGSPTAKFTELNAVRARCFLNYAAGGTTTINNTSFVDIGANYFLNIGGFAGIRTANLASTTLPSTTFAVLYTDGDASTSATINAQDNGIVIFGGATTFNSSFGNVATLDTTSGSGSTIIGYAFANGGPAAQNSSLIGSYGQGSLTVGSCGTNDFSPGTGGNDLSLQTTGEGSFAVGSVSSVDGITCTGSMSASARGSMVQGMVEFDSASSSSEGYITASGSGGSFARGYVRRGIIEATNQGSFAAGYSNATSNTAAIRASGLASVAFGRIVNSGSIVSGGNGSFVSGNSNGTATITGSGGGSLTVFQTTSSVATTNSGAGSLLVTSLASSGAVTLSGAGSAVVCQANSTGTITVSSAGSFFFGRAASTGSASITTGAGNFGIGDIGTVGISATGSINCGQIGQGANTIASSVRFGEAIRILEIPGTATASNGDINLDSSNIVNIHSNGIARNIQKLQQNTNFSVTGVGNVGTGVDDLISLTFAASQLTVNGDRVIVKGKGTFAANANNKQVRSLFGATQVVTTGAVAINGGHWVSEIEVVRTGATAQIAWGYIRVTDGAGVVTTYTGTASPAETLSGAVTIKWTGEATSNNDIVQDAGFTEIVRVS